MSTAETPQLADAVEAAALHRRSIRKYLPQPVPDAEVRQLLRLAGRAPSAWNLQPWRWVVVRDPEVKAELHAVGFRQRQIESASTVLVLYSDMVDVLARLEENLHPSVQDEARAKLLKSVRGTFERMTPEARDAWGRAQTNIALGYLLLIAETRGIATSPMLGFDPAGVKRLLSLPEHAEVAALIAIGYGDEEGTEPHRLDVDTLTQWT